MCWHRNLLIICSLPPPSTSQVWVMRTRGKKKLKIAKQMLSFVFEMNVKLHCFFHSISPETENMSKNKQNDWPQNKLTKPHTEGWPYIQIGRLVRQMRKNPKHGQVNANNEILQNK